MLGEVEWEGEAGGDGSLAEAGDDGLVSSSEDAEDGGGLGE